MRSILDIVNSKIKAFFNTHSFINKIIKTFDLPTFFIIQLREK